MIINKDIIQFCKDRDFEEPKFHAVLCDPPYELGFMGKTWDSTGIAFDPKTWKAIADQCHPGAYLLAFGGTRTFHRIAVAIEDAGFEIRDTVMWVYGSGFPKSHNVGKAVDKAEGNEREVVGERHRNVKPYDDENGWNENNTTGDHQYTKGTSPWEGYGTALKPAWEPVIIARLPLNGTVAKNAQRYGSGALNIDGTRVGTEEIKTSGGRTPEEQEDKQKHGLMGRLKYLEPLNTIHQGRWPANLIHDGSDEVVGMFPGEGEKSAARFFYSAKVSKRERDAGLEGFEEKQIRRLSGGDFADNSGSTNSDKAGAVTRNSHPTLKPLSLTKYLATLILPPKLDQPRRLLVPFAGAGSEVVGALQAGWDEVVGVEQSKEYVEIAEARIKHWTE